MRTFRQPIADKVIDRSIEDLRVLLDRVSQAPILDGVHIENVTLANGVTVDVPHRLGRRWRGWIRTGIRGASSTGRIVDSTSSDDTKFLRLTATGWGATITIKVWVF